MKKLFVPMVLVTFLLLFVCSMGYGSNVSVMIDGQNWVCTQSGGPIVNPCTYLYGEWGACSQTTKTQSRTLVSESPAGCVENPPPLYVQSCIPPGGRWSSQIASATKLDTLASDGAYEVGNFQIAQGGTYYFLIDPKGFGIAWPYGTRNAVIQLVATCAIQTLQWNIQTALYMVDRSGNQIGVAGTLGGSSDRSAMIRGYSAADYAAGNMYLLEIKELGSSSGTFNKIYWVFN